MKKVVKIKNQLPIVELSKSVIDISGSNDELNESMSPSTNLPDSLLNIRMLLKRKKLVQTFI